MGNWWEVFVLNMLISAVNADPNASPQMKSIAATIAALGGIYTSKTPGEVVFQPDGGGPPVLIVHVQP